MQQDPKEDEVVIDDPNGEKPVEKPEDAPEEEDRTPPESKE